MGNMLSGTHLWIIRPQTVDNLGVSNISTKAAPRDHQLRMQTMPFKDATANMFIGDGIDALSGEGQKRSRNRNRI